MGLLDLPKKAYDFVTKPEVTNQGGIVTNIAAGVKSMVHGVVQNPLKQSFSAVKTVKDSIVQGGTNIKNGATLNPFKLVKNVGKGTILTVNEGSNLISSGVGGTVEIAETVNKDICDAIDYTNSAVHSVIGLTKFIPVVGKTLSHAASIALSPVTLANKVLRTPAKISAKIRTSLGGLIANFHKNVSGKFAISASPSASVASSSPAPQAPQEQEAPAKAA